MVQLTQTALLSADGDIERLRREFAETGCALLPQFLAPNILEPLLKWIGRARFEERQEVATKKGVFGTTLLAPDTEPALFLLRFILNRPDLYRFSEEISGCERIGNFLGRLHRTTAATNQHIDWHHDVVDGRILGLCVNLSDEVYSGGELQLRDPRKRVTATIGPAAAGNAFFFRIDSGWEHRLTAVESGRRTVGVGWFRNGPEYSSYAMSVRNLIPLMESPDRKNVTDSTN